MGFSNSDFPIDSYHTVVYLHRHIAFLPSADVTEDKMQTFQYLGIKKYVCDLS